MKILRSHILLTLLTGLLLFSACKHETDVFDGPNLVDRFGDFSVLDSLGVSTNAVDFAAGQTVFFTARFNKRIDWIIRVTGQESGSVKEITGFDNKLTVDNATWNGQTTFLPLFTAENCLVELIVPEEDSLTMTDMVEVLTPRNYEGMVFTDFETDPGNNLFYGNFEYELSPNTGIRNDMTAGQGDKYYFFEGTDDVVGNFFVGLIDIKASITGQTYIPLPTTIPDQLYFNSFLFGTGTAHTIAVIQFIYDSNDSGAFEDGQDQSFQLDGDFPMDNVSGWNHIHHTMADVGMTEDQLSKMVAIRVLLISNMNSQPNPPLQVSYGLDYLTFTQGAPLDL